MQLEIDEILKLGVELKCNQALGASFLLKDLKDQGFQAVFLAIGAHRSKDLRMEGMDLDGVLSGVEFLLNVNLGFRVWLGHKVVVIGGGNVAVDVARTAAREGPIRRRYTTMDVARAAHRLGSREVHVICLESRDEMPAHGYEVEEAEREGIIFHPSTGPKKFWASMARWSAWRPYSAISVFDADGRFNPQFEAGSESIITADSIILSVGQTSDLSFLREEDGVKTTPRGTIQIDPRDAGHHGAGHFRRRRRGLRAAVDHRRHRPMVAKLPDRSINICGKCELAGAGAAADRQLRLVVRLLRRHAAAGLPDGAVERRMGFAEVELPFSAEQAATEGNRCLHCHQNIFLDGERCILCGGCVDVCPYHCIGMISATNVDWSEVGERFSGRGQPRRRLCDGDG